ncbi:hydroxyethylthiazole kinase [Bengtsoniella intestinalis]|uniref:hydroxyethylthiazole kinase n=1 Tax=Bengtsoniella intestinalis TaxID=3073143 RepID=UPI00391F8FDF
MNQPKTTQQDFAVDICSQALTQVRTKAPLVQCITNFVTVNDCANILLAVGGSPTMCQDVREAPEAVSAASALVLNMGAIDMVDSMVATGKAANGAKIPVVLDPVAVGGTALRRDTGTILLEQVAFTVIRGNGSEIRYLAGQASQASGVDVGTGDAVTRENLMVSMEMAKNLAVQIGGVIAVSGVMDIVTDGQRCAVVHNGCATMARITGSGCMLTTLIGAFCGAMPDDAFTATVAAMVSMGVAGELAEAKRLEQGTGNATFRTDLIDAIFNLTPAQLEKGMRCEIYKTTD